MKYNLPVNEKDKINAIRKQINLMNLSTLVEKNINQAINNFENGNFLECSLITSRVITYTINKLPVEYNALADCPKIDNFLKDVLANEEDIKAIWHGKIRHDRESGGIQY